MKEKLCYIALDFDTEMKERAMVQLAYANDAAAERTLRGVTVTLEVAAAAASSLSPGVRTGCPLRGSAHGLGETRAPPRGEAAQNAATKKKCQKCQKYPK